MSRAAVAIFWVSFGVMAFVYFAYPAIIFFLAKAFGKKPRKDDEARFVSMIIPFYNEEAVIKEKLQNLLYIDYPKDKLEIICALDGCTDRTKDFILEFNDPRIRILDYKERMGKVATLNRAVKEARGEILFFSDANTIHRNNTLVELVRSFADEKVGCVCGKLTYTTVDKTSVSKGENLYWKYENFIKRYESKLGKLLITNGSIQAVRKELYPFPDPEVADDFSIPILILAKGYKVVYEPKAVVFEVATQSVKEEFNQKARIVAQGFKAAVRLFPALLKLGPLGLFEFVFHKLLRWCVGFFLIAFFISNAMLLEGKFYRLVFILQLGFYALAICGFLLRHKRKIKIFYVPFYFCLVNFAAMVALFRSLRGRQTRMWEKAQTTRTRGRSPSS